MAQSTICFGTYHKHNGTYSIKVHCQIDTDFVPSLNLYIEDKKNMGGRPYFQTNVCKETPRKYGAMCYYGSRLELDFY
jgi:hypothetical protein